jgi:2-keto-4-pentenoate hydratase
MSDYDPDALAAYLLAARRARRVLPMPPPAFVPPDLAGGIAAQRSMARSVGADPPAGFKVGATARAMQDYLGLAEPLAGFIPAAGLHGSGSTLAYAGYVAPGVECEIAVHLGRDLPPGPCTPAEAAEAVDGVMAAIELVEQRYPDLKAFGASLLTADQVYHAEAVVGVPSEMSGYSGQPLDLEALPGRISVDGEERGRGFGRDLLGGPMRVLAWLAASETAAAFGGLRAGQIVMLGSVTTPVWLDGPCRIEVHFPPLNPVVLTLA